MLTALCMVVLSASVQTCVAIVDSPATPLADPRVARDARQDGTPLSDGDSTEATTTDVQNQEDCDEASSLENILEVMISMLQRDVPENVKTTLILKALTNLLKNTSAYNDEIMFKVNDLMRTLDKYSEIDDNKGSLRTQPMEDEATSVNNMVKQNKPNGKIRLKYELPGFKNPHCTEALLNIIKVVYQAYMSLAKSPICKSTSISIPALPSIPNSNNILPFILKPESIQNPDYTKDLNDIHNTRPLDETFTLADENHPITEHSHPHDDSYPGNEHDSKPKPINDDYLPNPQHSNIFEHKLHSKIPNLLNNGFPYDKYSESSPLNPYYLDKNIPQNNKVSQVALHKLPVRPQHLVDTFPKDDLELPLKPKISPITSDIYPQNYNTPETWPYINLQENSEESQSPLEILPITPYPSEIQPNNNNINLLPFSNLQQNPEESVKFPLDAEPNEVIPGTGGYHHPIDGEEIYNVQRPKIHLHPFKIIPHTIGQGDLVDTSFENPMVPSGTIPDQFINYLYPNDQRPSNPQHSNTFEHKPHSEIPNLLNNGFPYDKYSQSSPLNLYYPDKNTPQNNKVSQVALHKLPVRPQHLVDTFPKDDLELPLKPKISPITSDIYPQNYNTPETRPYINYNTPETRPYINYNTPKTRPYINYNTPETWPYVNLQEHTEESQSPLEILPTTPYPFEIQPNNNNINLFPFSNLHQNPEESVKFSLDAEPNEMIPGTGGYHHPIDGEEMYNVQRPKPHLYPFKIIPHTIGQGDLADTSFKNPIGSSGIIPDQYINYLYPNDQRPGNYHTLKPGSANLEQDQLWFDGKEDTKAQNHELPYYHFTSQPNAYLPNSETPVFPSIPSFVKDLYYPDQPVMPIIPFGPNKLYGSEKPYSNPEALNSNNFKIPSNHEDVNMLKPNKIDHYNNPSFFKPDTDSETLEPINHLPISDETFKYPSTLQTPKSLYGPHIKYNDPSFFKPHYTDSETEPINDLTHSDETSKYPSTLQTPKLLHRPHTNYNDPSFFKPHYTSSETLEAINDSTNSDETSQYPSILQTPKLLHRPHSYYNDPSFLKPLYTDSETEPINDLTHSDETSKYPSTLQTPKLLHRPHTNFNDPTFFEPYYTGSESLEPSKDLTHSDESSKYPSALIPHEWIPIGSETLTPDHPAPNDSDPTSPPEIELAPNMKVIGFIRDAIEVIEGLIPAVKFDPPTLIIIAKIKEILHKDTDINHIDYATILKLYKKLINYVKQLNEYRKIIDIIDLPRVTNHSKLKTEKVVELTYLVKRPQPLIYYPYYYVKYKLPYASLLIVQNLMKQKPHLRMDPEKLYKELLSDSNIDETSPDLNNLKRNDLLKLTVDTGSLVDAKIVGGNEELKKQLNILREITSELTSEALLEPSKKTTKNTTFTRNELGTEKNIQVNDVISAKNDINTNKYEKNDDNLDDSWWYNKKRDTTNPETLKDEPKNSYDNFPNAHTLAETDLQFTSFDSDKLRSDVLRGENVGLPYSDYVMPADATLLRDKNEPLSGASQGPSIIHKLINATLKASNSRLRLANQQNLINNGGLISSDTNHISLNTGTGNSQSGVTIFSPKIMVNQASINHAISNSDVTKTNVEANNEHNSVNTAITQASHQEFINQHNLWNQHNYLNLEGLVNFDHQNITLNAGQGNLQDNVSFISPEVMYNDVKHKDNFDHKRTSKAPTGLQHPNFNPDSDNNDQQKSNGTFNVTSPLGFPIDFQSPHPNQYGHSSIGSGNLKGSLNDNSGNIQKPSTNFNDNLTNAETKYPEPGPTNPQDITDSIQTSVIDDISQYANSGAGKEIPNFYQNTENPNNQIIYNNPVATSTDVNNQESYTETAVPQKVPGFNGDVSNAATQGAFNTGMGQSSADSHHSGDVNWGAAAHQQSSGNYYSGPTDQQNLGYILGVPGQHQKVKGFNLATATSQQNVGAGGYNIGGVLASQTGVLGNQQGLVSLSNQQILGGYQNTDLQYNWNGYGSGAVAGPGSGWQASQQNVAGFGQGGLSGQQLNYMFVPMYYRYPRPLLPTRVALMTPAYRSQATVVG